MATSRRRRQLKGAAEILDSESAPLSKVRKLVALGYDESLADNLVVNAQVGPSQAMFYEHLPKPEYGSSQR
jgi:hypothetical protein